MGWTDTIAASGFQILMVATGILNFVHTTNETILDLSPCDFVSNQILAQTVFTATDTTPRLNIVHTTTTTKNPLNIGTMTKVVYEWIKYNPLIAKPRHITPWFQPVESIHVWKTLIYLT